MRRTGTLFVCCLYACGSAGDKRDALATSEFTNGSWNVAEQLMAGAMPTTMLGGAGEWTAEHADDSAAPTGPGAGLCSGQSGFDTPP